MGRGSRRRRFPLKLTRIEDGKATVIAQVTSVEPRSLDDSLFTVPANYKMSSKPFLGLSDAASDVLARLPPDAPPTQGKKER